MGVAGLIRGEDPLQNRTFLARVLVKRFVSISVGM